MITFNKKKKMIVFTRKTWWRHRVTRNDKSKKKQKNFAWKKLFAKKTLFYLQQNFTTFGPNINSTLSVNYSTLSGANKTFTVYTDLDNAFTTNLAFNDYRWHVTSYTKGGSSFAGGYFTLTSNFTEDVLSYNSTTSSAGSGDLVILLGIDSSGTSTTPDKFIFVSGDFNGPSPIYPGRDDASNYNFAGGTKRIKFTKGSGTPSINKIWLFVGMKNTVTGKGLYLQNISFA
jgi:hypothetical protein